MTSFTLERILCLLVHSYSIQMFLRQNGLIGEISVKIRVESKLRFPTQHFKATSGLAEMVFYYYLTRLCYC